MNTNDFKTHVAKIFIAIGGVATTTVSCELLPYSENSDNFAKDQDEGLQMLPVDLYLSEEVNLNGILEFTNDVMSKPDFVQKFYENPEGILKKIWY